MSPRFKLEREVMLIAGRACGWAWFGTCVALLGCAGPPITIAQSSLPNGAEGTFYSTALSTDGTGPWAWNITSGALPAGLTLGGKGVISGTPTEAGTFSFTVTVTDSSFPPRTGQTSFELTIQPELTLDPALGPARVDEPYADDVEASGGVPPYTFEVIGLPAGLDFDPTTGAVTGTPLNPDLDIPLQVNVTDSGDPQQSKTAMTTLVVKPRPISIATDTLPDGELDESYDAQVEAVDGLLPYHWAVVTGVLPDGLRLNLTTGVISGTPTTADTFVFTIEVTDSDSPPTSDSRELMIDIQP